MTSNSTFSEEKANTLVCFVQNSFSIVIILLSKISNYHNILIKGLYHHDIRRERPTHSGRRKRPSRSARGDFRPFGRFVQHRLFGVDRHHLRCLQEEEWTEWVEWQTVGGQ